MSKKCNTVITYNKNPLNNMHTYNIDLIRKIYDLKSELSPKSSYSYSFLDKNTKKGEKVWIKFYNGDEMQNQQLKTLPMSLYPTQ